MGRIKSTFVKASAHKIYNKGGDEFSENFENNKEVVKKHADIPSKKMRNTIVGYITRLAKKAKTE